MRLSFAVLCAALLVVIAGCGSSNGGSASTAAGKTGTNVKSQAQNGEPPSKPFVPQANAICKVFNREIKPIQNRIDRASQTAASGKSFNAYVPVMTDAVNSAQAAAYRFLHMNVPEKEQGKAIAVARIMQGQTNLYNLMLTSAQKDDGSNFSAANIALQQTLPKMLAVQRGLGQTYICGGGKVKPQKGI